jgi:hypothetical protein
MKQLGRYRRDHTPYEATSATQSHLQSFAKLFVRGRIESRSCVPGLFKGVGYQVSLFASKCGPCPVDPVEDLYYRTPMESVMNGIGQIKVHARKGRFSDEAVACASKINQES